MTRTIRELRAQEAEFLSRLAAKGQTIFSATQAQTFWGNADYTANVLSRLVRKGWLQRLDCKITQAQADFMYQRMQERTKLAVERSTVGFFTCQRSGLGPANRGGRFGAGFPGMVRGFGRFSGPTTSN